MPKKATTVLINKAIENTKLHQQLHTTLERVQRAVSKKFFPSSKVKPLGDTARLCGLVSVKRTVVKKQRTFTVVVNLTCQSLPDSNSVIVHIIAEYQKKSEEGLATSIVKALAQDLRVLQANFDLNILSLQ